MNHWQEELSQLKTMNLYREPRWISSPVGPVMNIGGHQVLQFSSNAYNGLNNDQRVKRAAIKALEEYGTGTGASRLVSGSFDIHQKLEQKIALHKKTESALLFSSGYAANLGIISAVTGKDWVIYCDKLNHASIIDGCRLSGAKLAVYQHCDTKDLLHKVQRYKDHKGLIVTDGVFSMDGDIAPLPDIYTIARDYGLLTMVDDAHAAGVIGITGAGTSEYFGLQGKIDIEMGTLSKAYASEGAYVAGSFELIEYLRHKARSFVYSTALAPVLAASAMEALDISIADATSRESLLALSKLTRSLINDSGFDVPDGFTPIIPVILGTAERVLSASSYLMKQGFYVPAIRPPTVKTGQSRLRISLMTGHSENDIRRLVSSMALWKAGAGS